jgi:hypothetical protein
MGSEYPQWQKALPEAILEFNPQHIREEAQRAEEVMVRGGIHEQFI